MCVYRDSSVDITEASAIIYLTMMIIVSMHEKRSDSGGDKRAQLLSSGVVVVLVVGEENPLVDGNDIDAQASNRCVDDRPVFT